MKLLSWLKTNNLSKILFWFFLYTIITFVIGVICKIIVSYHVNDIHNQLEKTSKIFQSAYNIGTLTNDIKINNSKINISDFISLNNLFDNINSISTGDANADRFLIYSKHISHLTNYEIEALKLLDNFINNNSATINPNIINSISKIDINHILTSISGFHDDLLKDIKYTQKMIQEANMIFWLQIGLIILTLISYPYSIYKFSIMKHNKNIEYTKQIHTRLILEYSLFLIIFIVIDAYATYLLFVEHVPLNTWNIFTIISMAIPTVFAIGSLIYIKFLKTQIISKK